MALFGIPGAIGAGSWLLATQMITAWQFVPGSMEEAKEFRNWSRSIGAVLSPLFLLTSSSFAAGYFLLQGGKLAIEYTRSTMESIGETFKKSMEVMQAKKTIAMDDWVMLDENKPTTKKKRNSAISDPFDQLAKTVEPVNVIKSNSISSNNNARENITKQIDNNFDDDFCPLDCTSKNLSSDTDWVLLDDML